MCPAATSSECFGALRVDAARNRERIVDAAARLFAAHGLDVPLEDVAREAGVGIATLYRRFPTRRDLVVATLRKIGAAYLEVIDRACAEPDPWEGVRTLMLGLTELQASDAALRELVVKRFPGSDEIERMKVSVQDRIEDLLERARASGGLRPDITRSDVALILLGTSEIVRRTADHCSDAWRRYAALQLEALRSRTDPEPLPPAPSVEAVHEALAH
ncbi:TetR/AcrR family transcriptional regulator [Nocardioides sp. Kera G14]|uniref:TetR/AcrR family transcriptional regulator n=1 Tax=Nocardioides sp. Kera G14 TaxID=2884264 RepID=UPI001D11AE68|nr:TetR/AcrR family transcriptional regulator [Nocardioides sp. Kera G14]UDY23959.1 TetR/AcrR family transcriptional regulator [Nocardioides sp. Kera G14]